MSTPFCQSLQFTRWGLICRVLSCLYPKLRSRGPGVSGPRRIDPTEGSRGFSTRPGEEVLQKELKKDDENGKDGSLRRIWFREVGTALWS